MARTTKRSEVVSMVATCGYPLAVLALLKKGLGNVFPTSGQCVLPLGHEWGHISLCLLRFEFCKKPVGRTLNFLLSISAHFVKAIKGKMLVADCPKARMQSRADEVRLSRPLTEWSDPHYP